MENFKERFEELIEAMGKQKRSSQIQMAVAVDYSIGQNHPLIVQAGTGTGKSMAYLVPAILSGEKVVISTATKALQEQLIKKDIPEAYESLNMPNRSQILKGRGNYVCLKKISELNSDVVGAADTDSDSMFDNDDDRYFIEDSSKDQLDRSLNGVKTKKPNSVKSNPNIQAILRWLSSTNTGDVEDSGISLKPFELASIVSTFSECPGAKNCSLSNRCYAEIAKRRAQESQIIVVNHALYAQHLKSNKAVLPDHDVVVFDEAHELEDILLRSMGTEISLSSINSLLSSVKKSARLLSIEDDVNQLMGPRFNSHVVLLRDFLVNNRGKRVKHPLSEDILESLTNIKDLMVLLKTTLANAEVSAKTQSAFEFGDSTAGSNNFNETPKDVLIKNQKLSSLNLIDFFILSLESILNSTPEDALWVEYRGEKSMALVLAQTDISSYLENNLFSELTAILTSATLNDRIKYSLGLANFNPTELSLDSPFDYESNALIYCPKNLETNYSESRSQTTAKIPIIKRLIQASKGRSLILCTSHKSVTEIYDALQLEIDYKLYRQDEYPKQVLLNKFKENESSCLVATQSFWQGVDVPGSALILVVIDKIPFPQVSDPFLEARRERSENGFWAIDVPYAAKMLAQGVGRLIRLDTDSGAVAILDSRLITKSYGKTLIQSLPPMRFSTDIEEVEGFLGRL